MISNFINRNTYYISLLAILFGAIISHHYLKREISLEMYRIMYVLTVIIIILYIFVGSRYMSAWETQHSVTRYISLDDIKTGDIFSTSYQRPYRILGNSITGVDYCHISVACWENNKLYIIEAAAYDEKKGLLKLPFSDWVQVNKNCIMLHCPLKIKCGDIVKGFDKCDSKIYEMEEESSIRQKLSKKILSSFEMFKNIKVEGLGYRWLKYLFPRKNYERPIDGRKFTCLEIATAILIESGILTRNKSTDHYSPWILKEGKFFTTSKYSYKKPYPIIWNNFALQSNKNVEI